MQCVSQLVNSATIEESHLRLMGVAVFQSIIYKNSWHPDLACWL